MKKTLIAAAFAALLTLPVLAQQPEVPSVVEEETTAVETTDSLDVLKQQISAINARLTEQEEINTKMLQEQKWDGIWNHRKYTSIFFAPGASCTELGVKSKSSWNFGLSKGTSYFFPSRPIAGILKVGLDVRWFDLSVIQYKKNDFDFEDDFDWDNPEWDDWEDEFLPDLGRYDIHIGAFGIGPTVSVAPFSSFNNEARFIRASLYFHYQPTFGLHLISEDGEVETSMAYCNMMDFGGKIQYRRFSIGVEAHWGSGKFSSIVSNEDFEDDYDSSSASEKLTRKFSSTRIYVSFAF